MTDHSSYVKMGSQSQTWVDSMKKWERGKTTYKSVGHFNDGGSDDSDLNELERLKQENQDLRSLLEEQD